MNVNEFAAYLSEHKTSTYTHKAGLTGNYVFDSVLYLTDKSGVKSQHNLTQAQVCALASTAVYSSLDTQLVEHIKKGFVAAQTSSSNPGAASTAKVTKLTNITDLSNDDINSIVDKQIVIKYDAAQAVRAGLADRLTAAQVSKLQERLDELNSSASALEYLVSELKLVNLPVIVSSEDGNITCTIRESGTRLRSIIEKLKECDNLSYTMLDPTIEDNECYVNIEVTMLNEVSVESE